MNAPNGLLLVDKPQGWTSHDVVACLRARLPRGAKVGHAGTLDPLATGLLILLLGRATKSAARLQGCSKTYSGTIRLGVETETGDLEGRVLREAKIPELNERRIQEAMDRHRGTLDLPPPLYSAVKFKGRPLYSYARQGIVVEPKPRPQTVEDWRVLSWVSPEIGFSLRCAGGTYVRSLASLLGESLGSVGVLSRLRREAVGDYQVADALPLALARELPLERLNQSLLPA